MGHVKSHLAERPYWCIKCGKVYKSIRSLRAHKLAHDSSEFHQFKSRGICQVCGTQLNSRAAVLYHRELHSGQKLKCTKCPKFFKTRKTLEEHIKRVHTSASIVECNICGKKFKQATHLTVHMRCHTNERPYQCSVCKKSFVQSNQLRTHQEIHNSEKLFSCSTCGKKFSQAQNLKKHQRHHSSDRKSKKHWCIMCNKGFLELRYLIDHCKTHTKERSHVCQECSVAFTSNFRLQRHISEVHRKDKAFKCNLCGKCFPRLASLNYHVTGHLKEKPNQCTVCDRSFRQVVSLTKHLTMHEKCKNLLCVSCDKRFLNRTDLLQHQFRVHVGSTENWMTCIFCGKFVGSLEYFENHLRAHILEKPFNCQKCSKCFWSKVCLSLHKKWKIH